MAIASRRHSTSRRLPFCPRLARATKAARATATTRSPSAADATHASWAHARMVKRHARCPARAVAPVGAPIASADRHRLACTVRLARKRLAQARGPAVGVAASAVDAHLAIFRRSAGVAQRASTRPGDGHAFRRGAALRVDANGASRAVGAHHCAAAPGTARRSAYIFATDIPSDLNGAGIAGDALWFVHPVDKARKVGDTRSLRAGNPARPATGAARSSHAACAASAASAT